MGLSIASEERIMEMGDLGQWEGILTSLTSVVSSVAPLVKSYGEQSAARAAATKAKKMDVVAQLQAQVEDKKWQEEQQAAILAKTREAAQKAKASLAAPQAPTATWAIPLTVAGGAAVLALVIYLTKRR
jgi:ElaB/YqjD/DUF883 family membrane-anchored ribosome-binding protein